MGDRLIAASSAYKGAPAFIHAFLPLLRSFSMGNPVNNAVKGSGVPHASLFSRERRDWGSSRHRLGARVGLMAAAWRSCDKDWKRRESRGICRCAHTPIPVATSEHTG